MRQSGRTTEQMKAAPKGSLYVWCNDAFDYPKLLARDLGRTDLVIVAPYYLQFRLHCPKRWPAVVLDHATVLNDRELQGLRTLNGLARP